MLFQVRQCINIFLSSSDAVVVPWLPSLEVICRDMRMRDLYYNISLIKDWESQELKQRYLNMLLGIIESEGLMVERGITEVEGFLLDDSQIIQEASRLHLIDLLERSLSNG